MKYTIKSVKPQNVYDQETGQWTDEIKKDSYGNSYYKITSQDEEGQVWEFSKGFKVEPKPGDTLDGSLEAQETNGRTWYKFTAEKKPFGGYSPKDNASIERQVALKEAYNTLNSMITAGLITPKSTNDVFTHIDSIYKHNVQLLKEVA